MDQPASLSFVKSFKVSEAVSLPVPHSCSHKVVCGIRILERPLRSYCSGQLSGWVSVIFCIGLGIMIHRCIIVERCRLCACCCHLEGLHAEATVAKSQRSSQLDGNRYHLLQYCHRGDIQVWWSGLQRNCASSISRPLRNFPALNAVATSLSRTIVLFNKRSSLIPQITSYDYTMKILLIVATVVAVIPVGLSLFVKDMYLSDKYVVHSFLQFIYS